MKSSKDLLVLTFILGVGNSSFTATTAQVVQLEPVEHVTISADFRPEDKDDKGNLCIIIDKHTGYSIGPHQFCETRVISTLLELGCGPPDLKDNCDGFPEDDAEHHFSSF